MRVHDDLTARLRPVRPSVPCKICAATAALHGVVDFNKSCAGSGGTVFPLAGVPIFYHRCPSCGFLFTEAFDDWDYASFWRHIYNDDYLLVDPQHAGERAESNSVPVAELAEATGAVRILDYGGGNGTLARVLADNDYQAQSWEPILPDQEMPAAGVFDIVSAFEVLEHSPTPLETCRQALSFLRPGGCMIFSTLTMDTLPPQACDHWYLAPRNGHVSLYTTESLRLLFGGLGYTLLHANECYHLAREAAAS
jgi:hypothetical protein